MATESKQYPRVLSIQSSVVYGYVGNKAATFPLQLLGYNVDPINLVQFSNHTRWPTFSGRVSEPKEVTELKKGLAANDFLSQYDVVLTGYLGSVELVHAVADLVKDTKPPMFLCDPVLGDDRELYVPQACVEAYRDVMLPMATLITPNQTEAELLTDTRIDSMATAAKALRTLMSKGPKTVIITSINLPGDPRIHILAATQEGPLATTDVTPSPSPASGDEAEPELPTRFLHLVVPSIPFSFTGVGDLCAALLLAWRSKFPDLQRALENAVRTMGGVLRRTQQADSKEMLLIESADIISTPPPFPEGVKPCEILTLEECNAMVAPTAEAERSG